MFFKENADSSMRESSTLLCFNRQYNFFFLSKEKKCKA